MFIQFKLNGDSIIVHETKHIQFNLDYYNHMCIAYIAKHDNDLRIVYAEHVIQITDINPNNL